MPACFVPSKDTMLSGWRPDPRHRRSEIYLHLRTPLYRTLIIPTALHKNQRQAATAKMASQGSGKFEPKQKVELEPPQDELISIDYLSKCDGP